MFYAVKMRRRFFCLALCLMALCVPFYNKAHSQTMKMGADLHVSVFVEVEEDLVVEFDDVTFGTAIVPAKMTKTGQSPAVIRIKGGQSEAMIDIEGTLLEGENLDLGGVVSISDFNILGSGAADGVGIMPFSQDDSFLVLIGGTVKGLSSNESTYKGYNVLNINYL